MILNKNVNQKIIVFGNAGSGKTTMSSRLSKQYNLAHLDLDTITWLDVKPPDRLPIADSLAKLNQFMVNNKSWVIEGCYTNLLLPVLDRTTLVIFLNLPVKLCVQNCKNRKWESHKYKSIEDQNHNLDMLIEWSKQYYTRSDEYSLNSHTKLFDDFNGKKIEYINNEWNLNLHN